jgi:hypothetical protein
MRSDAISRILALILCLLTCLAIVAVLLVFSGVLTFARVEKKHSTPDADQRSGSIRSPIPLSGAANDGNQELLPLHCVVETWEHIATDHNVPPESVSQVSSLLQDVFSYAEVVPAKSCLQRFEKSLKPFLENFGFAFEAEETASGTAYWLSFCTVQAFLRQPVSETKPDKILDQYEQFVEEIADLIDHRIQIELPAREYQKMRGVITEGLAKFRSETKRRIVIYRDDFLCPAFRKELDGRVQTYIRADYENPNDFPNFNDPLVSMMVTNSEAWGTAYRYYIENHIGMFLFEMFLHTTIFKLNKNRYWGYMNYTVEGMNDPILVRPACWPAFVRFVQDREYNEIYNWKREVQE